LTSIDDLRLTIDDLSNLRGLPDDGSPNRVCDAISIDNRQSSIVNRQSIVNRKSSIVNRRSIVNRTMMFLLRRLLLILVTVSITPLLALLAVMLLYFNLIHLLTRFTRKRVPDQARPLSGQASIVILNWNGKDLLAQGIPSVLAAVQEDGLDHEILVVDNGSTDGSVEYLRRQFPQVRVIPLPENLGFAAGNNIGVDQAQHDTVILLNNDMVVDRRFLRPLLEGFGPSTFAVSSQIYLQDASSRREETGKTAAQFRRGMIDFAHCALDGRVLERSYYPTLWAGGGSSAFHRERFLALGGFQEIYSPAYVEDTDLSYQAWKFG
jgi:hypothetical protein